MKLLGLLLQGVEPAIRESVWPFLLQLYPAGSSAAERQRLHSELHDAYSSLLSHAQVVKLFTCHFGNSSNEEAWCSCVSVMILTLN